MPPKAAEKKPSTGGKAPAGKAPAEKKEAGKKTAAPTGEKKKRNKTRKETYSSYIYKGMDAKFGDEVPILLRTSASCLR
jgi:histone H2B